MNWFEPLDHYCERVTPDFWAEPVNAISNLSFVFAAFFACRLGQKLNIKRMEFYWLVLVLLVIGVGSFLFHTFANRWSMFADILPIYAFQLSLVFFYGAAIGKQRHSSPVFGGTILFAFFLALTLLFGLLSRELLNGSIIYLPAVIILFLLGVYQANHARYEKYTLLVASLLLLMALVFRSIDLKLCHSFSVGTHFMWHLINGGVLYLVLRAYSGMLAAETN